MFSVFTPPGTIFVVVFENVAGFPKIVPNNKLTCFHRPPPPGSDVKIRFKEQALC